MADHLTQHRELYLSSILSLTENLRKCAEFGENFAKALKDASDEEMQALINANKRKASGGPDDEDGPRKRKRTTKPKDPNAPKRPASSYILFQNEIRKQLKNDNPNLNNSELLTMISELWKKMSDSEKEQYHKAVESAKERYSQDKKAYDNRSPEEVAAANAAAAEAAAAKKKRPRKKKAEETSPTEVAARPPPSALETIHSASSSDEDSDEEDSGSEQHEEKESQADSELSEDEEEEPAREPTPEKKKAKKPVVSAVTQSRKSKKITK